MNKKTLTTLAETIFSVAVVTAIAVANRLWPLVFLIAVLVVAALIYFFVALGKVAARQKIYIKSMRKCDPQIMLDWSEAHKNEKSYPPKDYCFDCCENYALLGDLQKSREYLEMYGELELNDFERFMYFQKKASLFFDDGDFENGEEFLSKANKLAAKPTMAEYRKRIAEFNMNLRYCMELKRKSCDNDVETFFSEKYETEKLLAAKCFAAEALAEIYFNRGDYEKMKKYCEYIVANGNRLYCVDEAKTLAEKAGVVLNG